MNELYHHGILGQKWGVRRSQAQLRKSKVSEDYTNAQELKKRKASSLSTKELKELNNRMQLEQQYNKLNPNSYQKGMAVVKGITAAGTTLASLYAITKTDLYKEVSSAIKSAASKG